MTERRTGETSAKATAEGTNIIDGQTPTSPNTRSTPYEPSIRVKRANLNDGDPTNRRAGCGKSARPVRREGERATALRTPVEKKMQDSRPDPNGTAIMVIGSFLFSVP